MTDCPHCGYMGGHADIPESLVAHACTLGRRMAGDEPGAAQPVVDVVLAPIRALQWRMVRDVAEHGAEWFIMGEGVGR